MIPRSKHWRPSRARKNPAVDETAARPLTKEIVESMTRRAPAVFWAAFWENIDTEPTEGTCWLWKGHVNTYGYGAIKFPPNAEGKRKQLLAHRIAYVQMKAPLLAGEDILHACDTRRCCNPEHMRPGTQLENLADMRAKGRAVLPPRRASEPTP